MGVGSERKLASTQRMNGGARATNRIGGRRNSKGVIDNEIDLK